MDFFFVVLIIGVVVIGSMLVLNHFRGFEGYRRRLPGADMRSRDAERAATTDDSPIYLPPIGSVTDGGHQGSHGHHGAADCGAGHGGHSGDAGGGCSDGGGGGHGH